METVVANLSGKARRTNVNGREYIVAPLTMIVPGVLNGSQGALYYPPSEVARSADAWNGIPLVVRHPVAANGDHVSGRDPEVLARQGIGHVYKVANNGKLTAEGWFDVEATRRVDNRVLQRLEAGQPIELSTGLYTDNEPAENGAHYNGSPYTHVARNYRPDHLAILPDQRGACSIKDGCGVLVNESRRRLTIWQKLGEALGITGNAEHEDEAYHCAECEDKPESEHCDKCKEMAANAFCPTGEGGGQDNSCSSGGGGGANSPASQRDTVEKWLRAEDPTLSITRSGSTDGKLLKLVVRKNLGKGTVRQFEVRFEIGKSPTTSKYGHLVDFMRIEGLPPATENAGRYGNIQSAATGKYKRYGAGTGRGEAHEAAQRGKIALTDRQRELGREAKAEADAGRNPPGWAVDEPTWERAKEAAGKGDYEDRGDRD